MAHKNKENWSPYKARQNRSKDTSQSSTKQASELKGRGHLKSQESYSFHEANDRLQDVFRNHGFSDFPHDQRLQLVKFYQLLIKEQELQNFTRLLNLKDIGLKHFIDCLMVDQLVKLQFPLLDIGSGPGFPGIPLKIIHPDKQIFLAEGVQKRVNFLKHVREEMRLENLGIFGRNINPQFLYPVNGVITRAVEEIQNTLQNVFYSLQTGGCVYFMKGPGVDPELEPAKKSWSEYYRLEKDIAYSLPHSPHERRLIVFRKIKPSPQINLTAWLDKEYEGDSE